MKTPILIAETPNAGKWGYRFLVSAGANIGDATVSAFVSKGRGESLIGGNYLAVRHNVIQRSTGRPDAGETLMLVGVDTSQISNEKRSQIVATLRSLLDKLDAVVQEIDWTNEKRLVVPHRSLAEWLSKDIRSLPTADITGGPQELGRPTTVPTNNDLSQQSSRNHKNRSLAISVLILFFLTAVALIIGKWPFQFGSDVVATSDNRGQQEGSGNPQTNNSTNRDEFAAHLEKLRREVSVAQGANQLKDIRSRLNELEQPRLTKNQQREIDDLRSEIDTKLKSINEEQVSIKKKNSDYFQEIEDSLSGAKDQGKLESLLIRLDQVPHSDKLTEDQRKWQELLRTNIKWKIFEVKYNQLVSKRNFAEAAKHLFEWKEGKQQELNTLKNDYINKLQVHLNETLDRDIQAANFSNSRKFIQSLEKSDVVEIVGKSFFQPSRDRLDVEEDKYLYERIAKSPSLEVKKDRVAKYLESQVVNKRMKEPVEKLKHYWDIAENQTDITFSITHIKWGSNITGQNIVELIVKSDGNEKSSRGQVVAIRGGESRLGENPIKISFTAKPNARISLEVRVYNSKTEDNGTYFYNGTILELDKLSDKWHELSKGKRDGNEIKLKVERIPKEPPKLPPYKE